MPTNTAKGWFSMRSASSPGAQAGRRAHGGWIVAVVLSAASANAVPADIYVICNPNVSLRAEDVRDVYIGEKSFAGSARLVPADNTAAQAAFLEKVVKVSVERYTSLWTKKSFRDGANPPAVKLNDAEALAYVRATPGACSYVQSAPLSGVNLVARY
jgi:hypothetical protein